jgi:hypothetical protein
MTGGRLISLREYLTPAILPTAIASTARCGGQPGRKDRAALQMAIALRSGSADKWNIRAYPELRVRVARPDSA